MNRDDIFRMAEESTPDHMIGGFEFDYEQLLHFAALIVAAEREACADEAQGYDSMIAGLIRARGQ